MSGKDDGASAAASPSTQPAASASTEAGERRAALRRLFQRLAQPLAVTRVRDLDILRNPTPVCAHALLAQSVEHETLNLRVGGSSPP